MRAPPPLADRRSWSWASTGGPDKPNQQGTWKRTLAPRAPSMPAASVAFTSSSTADRKLLRAEGLPRGDGRSEARSEETAKLRFTPSNMDLQQATEVCVLYVSERNEQAAVCRDASGT